LNVVRLHPLSYSDVEDVVVQIEKFIGEGDLETADVAFFLTASTGVIEAASTDQLDRLRAAATTLGVELQEATVVSGLRW
jgi:hypothetical protein